jgi:glycosyltransferase involved in cell wall biosynthesis
VVTPDFYRSSGVTTAMRQIYAGTRRNGIEHHFVSDRTSLPEDTDWIPPGRRRTFRLMSTRPHVLLPALARFCRWTRREGIDIVHVHHRRLCSLLQPLERAGRFKVVYTAQLTYERSLLFWLASPKRAVAISSSVRANLLATTRLTDMALIGNPTEFPDAPAPPPDTESRPRAVCVARLEPVKGHAHLLRAWAQLRDSGCAAQLVVVGEGSLQPALTRLIGELSLDDLVELPGFSPDVAGEFDRASFAVLPSEREGHPLAVIEAAARGRPTLVTDVDGSRDCIPPDAAMPNGVPYGEPSVLADTLRKWFTDAAGVTAEGARWFSYHRSLYSSQAVGERYVAVYRAARANAR